MTEAQSGGIMVWHWYSVEQAIAATIFCSRSRELEQNPPSPSAEEKARGLTYSEAGQREHRASVIAAIQASVGFLEASINELFASAQHPNLEMGGQLPEPERKRLTATAEMLAGNRLLDRYQLALQLVGQPSMDPGAQPCQDAALLVSLRNELVHYKPRWRVGGDPAGGVESDAKFVKALASKRFSTNPFTGEGNPFFPDKCLSADGADWAWRSARNYADEFFDRLGLRHVYRNAIST